MGFRLVEHFFHFIKFFWRVYFLQYLSNRYLIFFYLRHPRGFWLEKLFEYQNAIDINQVYLNIDALHFQAWEERLQSHLLQPQGDFQCLLQRCRFIPSVACPEVGIVITEGLKDPAHCHPGHQAGVTRKVLR